MNAAPDHVNAPASQEVLCMHARSRRTVGPHAHTHSQPLMILFETKWTLVPQRSNDNKVRSGSFFSLPDSVQLFLIEPPRLQTWLQGN